MGVMSCFRNGCTNVCCNRYSSKHGYICDSCYDELLSKSGYMKISKFMKTEKIDNDKAKEKIERTFKLIWE
jgi:hypothetical protein